MSLQRGVTMDNKIRISKDENGAIVLRFEKRDDCVKYSVYFRRENGRFKPLITTEKTAVRGKCGRRTVLFQGDRTDGRRKNGEYRHCGYFFAYRAYRLYHYGFIQCAEDC